jgi:hypothetical protein
VSIRVTIHEAELRHLLQGQDGPVVTAVRQVGQRVTNEARRRCPVDHGHLRASIQLTVRVESHRIMCRVGSSLPYALYVHEGTGLFGPNPHVIYPVSARVMVFSPGRAIGPQRAGHIAPAQGRRGGPIFATSTIGQPAHPFLTDALQAVSPWPVRINPTG